MEMGIFWDKKQYYTDGKYFNRTKTNIPASVSLLDMNGSCSMFEFPVNLRYSFAYSRKGNAFIATGLSTYIMKLETYGYTAEQNGNAWSGTYKYSNSGKNLFSILSMSAGYELKWNRFANLRIEPYYRLPLSGVGIGSLSITSAGIYFGLIHSFR